MYGDTILATTYYFLSLQSWFFAMKYLESSVNSSLTPTKITNKCINYTTYGIVIIYVTIEMTALLWVLITFPGWYNDGTRTEVDLWFKDTYS